MKTLIIWINSAIFLAVAALPAHGDIIINSEPPPETVVTDPGVDVSAGGGVDPGLVGEDPRGGRDPLPPPEEEKESKWPWVIAGGVALAAAIAGYLIADADGEDADKAKDEAAEAAAAAEAAQAEAAAANMAAAEEMGRRRRSRRRSGGRGHRRRSRSGSGGKWPPRWPRKWPRWNSRPPRTPRATPSSRRPLAEAQAAREAAEAAALAAANPEGQFRRQIFITGTFVGPATDCINDATGTFVPSITFAVQSGDYPGGIRDFSRQRLLGRKGVRRRLRADRRQHVLHPRGRLLLHRPGPRHRHPQLRAAVGPGDARHRQRRYHAVPEIGVITPGKCATAREGPNSKGTE